MKKILVSIILVLSLVLLSGCSSDSVSEIRYSNFQKKLANNENFILEVIQDGCSYCSEFAPKFDKVLTEYGINAYSLNLSSLADAERKEFNNNFQISGTPCVLFFENGEEVSILSRINGNQTKDKIIEKLKTNGYIK